MTTLKFRTMQNETATNFAVNQAIFSLLLTNGRSGENDADQSVEYVVGGTFALNVVAMWSPVKWGLSYRGGNQRRRTGPANSGTPSITDRFFYIRATVKPIGCRPKKRWKNASCVEDRCPVAIIPSMPRRCK